MGFACAIGLILSASTSWAAVLPRLNNGDHLNIAAIGTSLTAASFNSHNWFAQTGEWLSAKYPGQVTLLNRAVSGTASKNLPEYNRPYGGTWQLEQVLANDNPDAVFIEFAINDAYKTFNISPAQSANNLKTLITRINGWAGENRKNVDIIVQTMNNTGESYAASENDLAPYYQAWREEAVASNVLLIDHYPNWIKLYNSETDHAAWKAYITDDIHPNTQGVTNVILPEVQRVLMSQVPEPKSALLLGALLMGLAGCAARKWRVSTMVAVIGLLCPFVSGTAAASAASLGNIMPLGDSITYGSVPGGYRTELYKKLTNASYSFLFVGSGTENTTTVLAEHGQACHEGHPSIRLDQIEANLDGNTDFSTGNGGYWLSGTGTRTAAYPDVVLLLAGINDIALGASAAVARDRLDSLVGHVLSDRPNAAVFVGSLTPLTGTPSAKWTATANAFNAMIPNVVTKYASSGRKAYFVDMFNSLNASDISSDGVHPNQAGYDKMGDAWFAAMQSVPEPSPTVLLTTGTIGALAAYRLRRSHGRMTPFLSLSIRGRHE